MPALASDLRRVLENTIIAARDQATVAAAGAVKRLAVASKEFPSFLTPPEQALRRRLRASARQLGDPWNADKQLFASVDKLIHEVAYEHWHRMLFARYLAENNLLIHPDHGVHVDLSTVAELAQEEAAQTGTKPDTWALAGRFAAGMLPRIFRPDDPALALQLAPEHQQELERLLESLPAAVFTADDSLGWVYQFWQSAEKDRVNASGDKITGDTLPAVTQLFTEHYMVLFLLHNTVGAWWAGKRVASGQWSVASEEEARAAVALPGYTFDYLRFVPAEDEQTDDQSQIANRKSKIFKPAAGMFSGWPRTARELTVLDPCCGSGHFLVAVLELLIRLRMEEEGLSVEDAARAVIDENLFGLELDARCTQIAAFNVAMTAWKLAGYCALPAMNIACTGLAPNTPVEQWLKLVEKPLSKAHGQDLKSAVRSAVKDLHAIFTDAPTLGSLIDVEARHTVGAADWETVYPFLTEAMKAEGDDADLHADAVGAAGIADAARILAGPEQGYSLVITNVPYLGRGKQDERLQQWCAEHEPDAKADLATVFISRSFKFLAKGGSVAVVSPESWLFLTTYKRFREHLLQDRGLRFIAALGEEAFQSFGIRGPRTTLTAIDVAASHNNVFFGVSVGTSRGERIILPSEKELLLRGSADQIESPFGSIKLFSQSGLGANPDSRITIDAGESSELFSCHADSFVGLQNNDTPRFTAVFWELPDLPTGWDRFQLTTESTRLFSGRYGIVRWPPDEQYLVKGREAWGRRGVLIRQMGLPATLYDGSKYDQSNAALIPFNTDNIAAVWSFCSSEDFRRAVRQIDPAVKVPNATLVKIPFDLAHWQQVAAEKYPNGLPEPESDDPTQWLFHGRPEASEGPGAAIQVAVARLAGYRWPAELADVAGDRAGGDSDVADVISARTDVTSARAEVTSARAEATSARAEATSARAEVISARAEVTSARTEVTSARAGMTSARAEMASAGSGGMRLSARARDLVARCDELLAYADADGVIPLAGINHEKPADQRVRQLLEAAYGQAWSPGKLNDLLTGAGSGGKSLEDWLRNDFFAQHTSLFHHRPFIWQIWDGKRDGFSVLVNYHKLDRKLLEKITYTYLGDWITQQQAAARSGTTGADARLKAAQDLQKKLALILEGEPPYDIFVRWKPLHEQPIGWTPDLNDGVRMNIRPFVTAGVLRSKVNVKWKKDRGKEPQGARPKAQFPWFWDCPEENPPTDFAGGSEFTGERLNDLHYTNAFKQAARETMKEASR